MRKNKHIIISLLIVLIITFITLIGISKNINKDKKYNTNKEVQTDKEIYDYFTIKIDDINKLINDEISGYVYFGRDTCPICLYLNKFLEKEYINNNDLLIYKFDTDYWRENKSFKDILNKYNISTIPTLIRINKDQSYEILEFHNENEEQIQLELNNFLNKKK